MNISNVDTRSKCGVPFPEAFLLYRVCNPWEQHFQSNRGRHTPVPASFWVSALVLNITSIVEEQGSPHVIRSVPSGCTPHALCLNAHHNCSYSSCMKCCLCINTDKPENSGNRNFTGVTKEISV